MRTAAAGLREAGAALVTQADEQEGASSAVPAGMARLGLTDSGTGGPAGPVGSDGHRRAPGEVDPDMLLDQLSAADTLLDLGMELSLKDIPKGFRYLGAAFSLLGVVSGGDEVVEGIQTDDQGLVWGGVLGVTLGTLGLLTAAGVLAVGAPVAAVIAGAGIVASTMIPYSDASQEALFDFQAERMFGTDRDNLTYEQGQALADRYTGSMTLPNMVGDKLAQSIDEVGQTLDGFVSLAQGH